MLRYPSKRRREGVILVVVVSLLALFAVVGLSFVIYSESAATASRISGDFQRVVDDRAHIEPELLLNRILGALIYDHPDDPTGVYSALRGHSLARNMYGSRGLVPVADPTNPAKPTIFINTDTVPFNGTGPVRDVNGLQFESSTISFPGTSRRLSGLSRDQIMNFTYFNRTNPNERDPIIREAERYPVSTTGPLQASNYRTSLAMASPYRYFGGANVPYTYPDSSNVYLGAVRSSDGQVLIPSFHRPYLFLGPTGTPDLTFLTNTTHPDWYTPSGRLKLMRPRPIDQVNLNDSRQQQIWQANGNPPFPPSESISAAQLNQYSNATRALINQGLIMSYPIDAGGDVKNLMGGAGGNDSIWLDLGLPVRITRSGKKFKPLVAMLVTDLDGRVNLNIHGNLRGQPGGSTPGVHLHASNQGFGRWEVNPMHVLSLYPQEFENLFKGIKSVPGRFTTGIAATYPRPVITIGQSPNSRQVDLSSYGSSFLNPPNSADTSTVTDFIFGTTPITWFTQYPGTSMPNHQYDPPYFRIDLDGANETLGLNRVRSSVPFARAFNPAFLQQQPLLLSSFPDYYTSATPGVPMGYGNETTYPIPLNAIPAQQNDPTSELFQSAMLYNPLRNTGNSRQLDAMEMHNIVGRYNSPLDVGDTLLARLLPQNLMPANALTDPTMAKESAKIRHRITLVSADVGRAGLMPQTNKWTSGSMSEWTMPATPAGATVPLAQQGEPFPDLQTFNADRPIGSILQPGPSDFSGTALFAFAPGQQAPAYPNNGGSLVKIVDPSSTKPIATFDGRSGVTDIAGRVDLNRPLAPYPPLAINSATGMTYTFSPNLLQQIQRANEDRTHFAQEIFDRLRMAVGAPPMEPAPTSGTPQYQALQYLAQLAVNIVDDIDEDDVNSVFRWNVNAASPAATDFVYGVELPKVVLNEAYFEQTNGPQGDATYVQPPNPPLNPQPKALKYQINVWAELNHTMVPPFINPGVATPGDKYAQFRDRHAVWLNNSVVNPTTGTPSPVSTYRMYLIKDGVPVPTVGDAVAATSPDFNNVEKKTTFDSATKKTLFPVDTRVAPPGPTPHPCGYRCETGKDDVGFYVVGPESTNVQSPGTTMLGTQAATHKATSMSYDERLEDVVPNPVPPQVVLQRLANPYLPPQPDLAQFMAGAQPYYNPYITVDVMKATPPTGGMATLTNVMNKQIMYDKNGNAPGGATTKKSVMRRQPFAGAYEHLVMSSSIQPGPEDQTMFRHNGRQDDAAMLTALPETGQPGLERFDWYIHHDRKLVSPMELIHVAAVAPWDVTKSFIRNDPVTAGQKIRQGHTAPWFDKYEQYGLAPTGPNNPIPPYTGVKSDIVTAVPPTAGTPSQKASTRLYRALEQFRVGDRGVEMAFGGRDLGKININTIWDQQVFNAICDANSLSQPDCKSGFTQFDVDSVWQALTNGQLNLTARSPNLSNAASTSVYSQITAQDRPFLGMGSPHAMAIPDGAAGAQYPAKLTGLPANPGPEFFQNAGVEATVFRSIIHPDPMAPAFNRQMIFDVESQSGMQIGTQAATDPTIAKMAHPMLEKSLLSKIFEHLTTRSNVFAVYMTVGYFEVTDDNQKPELLGDEIGILRDAAGQIVENKAIRHRMFAIVDRTNLSLQPPRYDGMKFVDEDLQKQGPPPFYYTVPVGQQTVSGRNLWTVDLPIVSAETSGPLVKSITGSYNGMSWMLHRNDVVYLGTGSEQRRLVIRMMQITSQPAADGVSPAILSAKLFLAAPPATANPNWPTMDTNTPKHPVLITNVIAGNPGPQPDFDHRLPNYRGVVLYSVILD